MPVSSQSLKSIDINNAGVSYFEGKLGTFHVFTTDMDSFIASLISDEGGSAIDVSSSETMDNVLYHGDYSYEELDEAIGKDQSLKDLFE